MVLTKALSSGAIFSQLMPRALETLAISATSSTSRISSSICRKLMNCPSAPLGLALPWMDCSTYWVSSSLSIASAQCLSPWEMSLSSSSRTVPSRPGSSTLFPTSLRVNTSPALRARSDSCSCRSSSCLRCCSAWISWKASSHVLAMISSPPWRRVVGSQRSGCRWPKPVSLSLCA